MKIYIVKTTDGDATVIDTADRTKKEFIRTQEYKFQEKLLSVEEYHVRPINRL